MRRPRSLSRNPLIRRIQRHTSVATMMRASLPQTDLYRTGGNAPYQIIPFPNIESPSAAPSPEPEIPQTAYAPQTPLSRPASSPASPLPQTSPGSLSSPVPSTPAPVAQTRRWTVPNIFRKWQENRAAAKAEKSQFQPKSPLASPASSRPPVLQAKPVQQQLSQPPLPSPVPEPDLPAQPPQVNPPMPGTVAAPPQTTAIASMSPAIQRQNIPASSTPPQAVVPSQPEAPSQPSVQRTETEDPTWQRLQAIRRAHEGASPDQPSLPDAPMSEPVRATLLQAPASAMPPTIGPQPGSSGIIQAKAISPAAPPPTPVQAPAPSSSGDNDPAWKRLQTIMRKHEEKQALEAANPPPAPAPPSSSTSLESTKKTAQTPVSSIQRSSADRSVTPTAASRPDIPTPSPRRPDPRQANASQPSSESPIANWSPEPETEQTQIFPAAPEVEDDSEQFPSLEEVWPVQRMVQPGGVQPAPAQAPNMSPPLQPAVPALQPEEEAVIRKVNESAKTGQTTDSHVELILPRSPRPSAVQKTEATKPPAASPSPTSETTPIASGEHRHAPGQVAFPNTPFDRSSSPLSPTTTDPASSGSASPATPSGSPPSASPTNAVQTQRTETSPKITSSGQSSRMIPTEIGDLPSDLWELMGYTPPSVEPPPSPTSEATAPPPPASTPSAGQPSAPVMRSPILPDVKTSPTTSQPPSNFAPAISTPRTSPVFIPSSESSPHISSASTSSPASLREATTGPPKQRASSSASVEAFIQQAVYQPSRVQTTSGPSQISPAPIIQRVESGPPAPQNAAPASNQGEEAAAPTLSEQDLDKIARQVYSEIRQKLSIERERSRGWKR